jgi:hypothetical protein
MSKNIIKPMHIIILIIGLALLVGGIITGKHGASVIGLVIAAVNIQGLIKVNKKNSKNEHNS